MNKKGIIPHIRLSIGQAEIKAVTKVLKSGYLAMGPEAKKLETAMVALIGQKYGAVCSSGTTALHLSLLALGVGEGDEVILPNYSCQALLNAILYVKATPILVDIDLDTYNASVDSIKQAISKKTKAMIIPNMFGLMADLESIKKLGIPIIEDCAMGMGATLRLRPAGSFGDISIFSFYATKTITGGEGGMVMTSSKDIMDKVLDFREYDKKDDFLVRYNYKMSDINASIALAQLKQLKSFIKKRQNIAKRYNKALAQTSLVLPGALPEHDHAYARYIIRTSDGDKLREYLKQNGVGAGKGVVFGLHTLLKTKEVFPNSEEALKTAVSIPIYPTLTINEQQKIIDLLLNFKS